MQPERWRQIENIFQSALDCGAENRAALLDSACGEDAELRREIESLLAWHEKRGFMAPAAFEDAIKVLEHRTAQLEEGRRIGPYRVVREIGHGGMGSVFLAARADAAFQKLVAIKIIRRGLLPDDLHGVRQCGRKPLWARVRTHDSAGHFRSLHQTTETSPDPAMSASR